jgi:hypothetical protein
MQENKSMNKLWKESGTTLTFKEWLERENNKKVETKENFLPFNAEDIIKNKIEIKKTNTNIPNKNKVLGLDKGVVIFSGVLIAASIGYYVYTKIKSKNA